MPNPPIAWTIAGSDSGGGAGIQADIQTFRDFGVHGASVVTCVTAQNTVQLSANHPVPPAIVLAQLHSLDDDLPADAIKIGALGSAENAAAVIEFLDVLADARPAARRPFVVWGSGRPRHGGRRTLGRPPANTLNALLKRADAVTPNAEELARLERRPGRPDHRGRKN